MTRPRRNRPEPHLPESAVRQAIRRKLLRWYERHKRDLPWRRRAGDGYAQWVAEVMLQQTQVDTVIPYYERFMSRFPEVQSLAAASDDDLLRHWQGLGYYRRAANLHKAARQVAANGGAVPDAVESLLELPGVGRYTAGAVASIAFDRRAAAVDANVARVLARLFQITDEIARPATMRRLWEAAECLLPAKGCGDFNQALMDLGAAVCVPGGPRCERCPLRVHCRARAAGDAAALPRIARRAPVPEVHHVVAVIQHRDALVMVKRPNEGLWSGLWEFPNRPRKQIDSAPHAVGQLLSNLGLKTRPSVRYRATISHRLTHRLMHFDVFSVEVGSRLALRSACVKYRWVVCKAIRRTPMSVASRRILDAVCPDKRLGAFSEFG